VLDPSFHLEFGDVRSLMSAKPSSMYEVFAQWDLIQRLMHRPDATDEVSEEHELNLLHYVRQRTQLMRVDSALHQWLRHLLGYHGLGVGAALVSGFFWSRRDQPVDPASVIPRVLLNHPNESMRSIGNDLVTTAFHQIYSLFVNLPHEVVTPSCVHAFLGAACWISGAEVSRDRTRWLLGETLHEYGGAEVEMNPAPAWNEAPSTPDEVARVRQAQMFGTSRSLFRNLWEEVSGRTPVTSVPSTECWDWFEDRLAGAMCKGLDPVEYLDHIEEELLDVATDVVARFVSGVDASEVAPESEEIIVDFERWL